MTATSNRPSLPQLPNEFLAFTPTTRAAITRYAMRAVDAALAATPPLMAAVPAQTGDASAAPSERMGKSYADARAAVQTGEVARMVEALVAHIEAGECHHEDTYRGGAIWTICRGCDNKWADDRGGFKAYKRPAVLVQADKFLAALAHSPTVASPALVAEVGGLEPTIAGALFDFMGFLTTQISRHEER